MIGETKEVNKETEKILQSILERNQFDVVSEEVHGGGDSSVLGAQNVNSKFDQVPVGGEELKEDTVEDTHNPPVESAKTFVKNEFPAKEEEKKVSKQKEVEAKEPVSEARDIVGAVNECLEKDKQELFDLDLAQGPINLASLSPIHKIQLASFAQAKAREEILKSHIEDSELSSLASGILEKLMPTFVKDSSGTSSGQLKNLTNVLSTHFESLEKSGEVKI